MTFTELLFLSMALAIDVFGISFAYGLIIKKNRFAAMFQLAITCGLFQAIMPFLGFYLTGILNNLISQYAPFIICAIFTLLGINIIREALSDKEEAVGSKTLSLKTLFAVGIATSLDAFVSGAPLFLTQTPIFYACLIIGSGSFLFGILGFTLNRFFKKLPEKYLQITAGIVLILLGLKNLG